MSVSNTSKSTTSSASNLSKNNATATPYIKAGQGWRYDQVGITYDALTDAVTGLPIYYDAEGTAPTFTNLSKNNA